MFLRMNAVTRMLVVIGGLLFVAAGVVVGLPSDGLTMDVQGHRGARGLLPENSLPAFAKAQQLGVSTLEMDIKVTADGVLVITHDSRLNPDIVRDATGEWVSDPAPAVIDLTMDQLSSYDVGRLKPGTDYAARFPSQQPVDGTSMPALTALFDQVAATGDSRLKFSIETKLEPEAPELSPTPEEFTRLLVDEVEARGWANRVMIQSFDWRTLLEAERIAPGIPRVALTEADLTLLDGPWTAGLRLADFGGSVPRLVRASGADVWSPNHRMLSPEWLEEAHRLGLKVVPWTLSEPGDIVRMVAMGVDGIISDYPDRAIGIVRDAEVDRGRQVVAALLILVGVVMIGLTVGARDRLRPA